MATAAGDSTGYGGGAGGKFRRRSSRKPQTTPYDRPPTALRLTRRNDDSSSTGGWLSRIVDPASKLITASAHKLFSSVFRKRLLPPPQPSKDEEVEILENHFGDAMTETPSTQERDTTEGNTENGYMIEGVTGLANILKQKTFTRSEIDRLTALLHSREEVKTATEGPAGHARHSETRGTAFRNGLNPYGVSGADLTPAVRSNVNVGNVASPTDLAKAYMGTTSTRVSPSTLSTHSQASKEEIPALITLPSHRSSGSIMQKNLSSAVTSQKDFVVPRSRGRSAIYSMARTPYFKAQQTVTKGLGTANDASDGISLLSSQKTLKRRSSVLENDIGSIGPIRRIRQKPNLLYPKTLDLPSSCTPCTSATPSASSSRLHEGGGEKSPFSSSHVSSKSVEMGKKILQQLEKLTPPKDKYNENKPGFPGGILSMKLTPSMLSGQARKSLETVDLSKYVQDDEVCEKKVDSGDTFCEKQDPTTKEQDKFNNNSSKALMISSSNGYPKNGDGWSTDHDVIGDTKNTAPVVIESTIDAPKKSPAFQMSAYEDDWDMDDDAYATPSVNEGKRNLVASYTQSNGKLPEHPSFSEASKVGRPSFLGVESSSNSVLKNATTVEASNIAEKGISHAMADSVLNNTVGSSIPSSQPVETSVADKAGFAASTVSFDLKSSEKLSPPSYKQSSAVESSKVADETTSSFALGAALAHAPMKSLASNNNSNDAVRLFKQADTAPTSVPGSSISTIGSFPSASTAPSPVMFSSPSPFSVSSTKGAYAVNNGAIATAQIDGSSENVNVSVAFPSFQSTFGGSPLTSATMAAPVTHTTEESKGADLVKLPSSNLFGAASAPAQSSASSSFQFGATVTSSTKTQSQASDNVSNGSIFGGQTSPSATASASTTAGSLPSGSAPSSSSFAFGSSSSGSSSVAAAFGSVSSASTSIFGGSSQQTSSPVFGSTFNNSSSELSFGASAATPSSSASSAFSFGLSSMSAPANGSPATVAFGSSSTSTAPPSGNASSGFAFGVSSISAPANGASNGGSASAGSSVFGFGASSSASSAAPSSTFSFGASPATASSSAPSPSAFSFGASPTPASSSAPSSSAFSFGASPAPSSSSSATSSSTFSFGTSPAPLASSSAPSSSTFSFGAPPSPPASSSAPSSSTFSFGASPSPPASSSAPSSTFSFGASPAIASSAPSSTFSFGASSTPSASSSAPSSTFSFGASSSAASSTFSFGASSAPTSSTTPSTFLFGVSSATTTSTTAAAPVFPFGSAAPPTTLQPTQPAFGSNSSVFGFGSTPSPSSMGNNDQMSMEDSMVEDSMHQSPITVFGQNPTTNFSFGMAQPQPQTQLGANPFQFGGQQNQLAASANPFQASGSFDGGSFSLGAGGNDKSNRRIVKVKSRNRKK